MYHKQKYHSEIKKKSRRSKRGCLTLSLMMGILLAVLVLLVGAMILSPALAAQGSDTLRNIIGDDAVAHLEGVVFQVQDVVKQWRYDMGFATSSAPWTTTGLSVPPSTTATPNLPLSTDVPAATETVSIFQATAAPEPSPTVAWMPSPVIPLGSLDGEGVWSVYIQDSLGQTVAYRTYLQPDRSRPYAVVGVVAFDTSRTRLHYMLGSKEPASPDGTVRNVQMPANDMLPGVLLAMFNGGFKARHGHFGAMANGLVALPPREDLGTISILNDGRLTIGEWGSDIQVSADMAAWRQNGPLVVHDGQINPRIYNDSPSDWGYTVDEVSPTWRSGIGLSRDGKTFYYLCGSSLSMEMLGKSMLAAGIYNGFQLDINNYWVHFVAVRDLDNSLSLEPLFPDMMFENIDRYLHDYSRDYFYVTLAQ